MTSLEEPILHHVDVNIGQTELKAVEAKPIEDLMKPSIEVLNEEIEETTNILEALGELDKDVLEVVRLVNAAEITKMHYEFILAMLQTETEEEVTELKKKFKLVGYKYEKINRKEDLAIVITKPAVAIFHETIVLELRRLMKKCFKKHSNGEIQFIRSKENLDKIQIIAHRFEMTDVHFPIVLSYAKDDIFCFEKTSPLWRDLYESVTFKQVLTKQEIEASFKPFHMFLHITHIILNKHAQTQPASIVKASFTYLRDALYYAIQHSKAKTEVLAHLTYAQVDEAFGAWNLTDYPLLSNLLLLRSPKIGYDDLIYVPRLFPAITEELILKEYQENTINKLTPIDPSELVPIDLGTNRADIIRELFINKENKIPIRILAPENLNLQKLDSQASSQQGQGQAIVIHIHGGGFVSMSSSSHRVYLLRWVKNLKLIHFSIDYRLAPKNPYPDALDDVWQAYLWIMNYAESILGIKYEKVIFTGDSAGGNLAIALTLRLIKAGLKPPHGCLLIYPCLSVDGLSSSPSYFGSLDDPVLPYTILKLVAKAYVKEGFKNLEDPFISPMVASDDLLQGVPPIRIVSGSNDPLYDDSWRLLSKLKRLKKDVKMIVHENLSHAYMCFQELKKYEYFVEESADLIKELIALDP